MKQYRILPEEVLRLKKAADTHPIEDCDAPAHPRHHSRAGSVRLCLTKNLARGRGDRYYLSMQDADPLSDDEAHAILSLFLGPEFTVEEVWGIATPNVRCFSWECS